MIISHNLNKVFIHIPKNAGTSVRNALAPLHDGSDAFQKTWIQTHKYGRLYAGHLPASILLELMPETFEVLNQATIYAIVRNPQERFFSAITQHCKEYREPWQYLADEQKIKLLHYIMKRLRETPENQGTLPTDLTHFIPQIDFLRFPNAKLKLYPLSAAENLIEDFTDRKVSQHYGPLPYHHLNQSLTFKKPGARKILRGARKVTPDYVKKMNATQKLKRYILNLLTTPAPQIPIQPYSEICDFVENYYTTDCILSNLVSRGPINLHGSKLLGTTE